MKSCFNTITAGRGKRLEEIIEQSGLAGFAAVEIDQYHIADCLKRASINEIKQRLDNAGLQTASIMAFNLAPFDKPEPELVQIRKGAEYARQLGASMLLVYCAANLPDGVPLEEGRNLAAERTVLYADAVKPIAIGLEPIGRTTVMGGPAAALDIMARAGRENVGIVMDTFHFYRSQVAEAEVRAIPRGRLLIVHVNDAEGLPIDQLRDGNRLHVGQGVLPLIRDLRVLKDIGYDGFLSIEIFREEYWQQPVDRVIREAKNSLDSLLTKAGIG
jgi:2-keto-myo-inositol isomerase